MWFYSVRIAISSQWQTQQSNNVVGLVIVAARHQMGQLILHLQCCRRKWKMVFEVEGGGGGPVDLAETCRQFPTHW
jgi:surface antigen